MARRREDPRPVQPASSLSGVAGRGQRLRLPARPRSTVPLLSPARACGVDEPRRGREDRCDAHRRRGGESPSRFPTDRGRPPAAGGRRSGGADPRPDPCRNAGRSAQRATFPGPRLPGARNRLEAGPGLAQERAGAGRRPHLPLAAAADLRHPARRAAALLSVSLPPLDHAHHHPGRGRHPGARRRARRASQHAGTGRDRGARGLVQPDGRPTGGQHCRPEAGQRRARALAGPHRHHYGNGARGPVPAHPRARDRGQVLGRDTADLRPGGAGGG